MLGSFITVTSSRKEKAMAPHSSTLAWEIPWMEEPGRLQSVGSRRVGHDWATSLSLFTFIHCRRKWQPNPEFLPGESQGREPGGLPSMGSHGVGLMWLSSSSSSSRKVTSLLNRVYVYCYYLLTLFISYKVNFGNTGSFLYFSCYTYCTYCRVSSVQSLSRIWLWDPMDCSTPGLPVHHQLPEFTQSHVHWVGDDIQPSHPLLSPSPPAFNLSQH